MSLTQEIKAVLARSASSVGLSIETSDVPLEHTDDFVHGDYASGIALARAKEAGMAPRVLAEKIVGALGDVEGVAQIAIAGPGFINFQLSSDTLEGAVEAAASTDMWGANDSEAGKTIMMEYTDPNPFKEFHIGHLVPNAIGESLSRFFQFSGAHVLRANYQGDVGLHVAKSLFILVEKGITDPTIADLSAAYPEGNTRYEEDANAKAKIDALNKTIYEKSDPSVVALYEKGRALSLAHFEEIYKVLGTKFDHYFFESETGPIGKRIVEEHPDLFVKSDGATVFRGEEHGLHTRVFLTAQGLPTYEAKELGLAKMKEDTARFDLTITITANEQKDYFDVAMKAAELALPELSGKLSFRTHGLLRFASGKMSSRTGNIVRGEDLIEELSEAARARASESRARDAALLARQIAVAAIKYQILRQVSHKDIVFDRERALSLEGDSGPYLQYTRARAFAVLQKAEGEGVKPRVAFNAEPEPLARLLHRFPEIVERAKDELEPHLLSTYLLQLAGEFNSWYARVPIVDDTDASPHKVALTAAVERTLKNGLWLLGIPAPERM